jgi:hypothetical protein
MPVIAGQQYGHHHKRRLLSLSGLSQLLWHGPGLSSSRLLKATAASLGWTSTASLNSLQSVSVASAVQSASSITAAVLVHRPLAGPAASSSSKSGSGGPTGPVNKGSAVNATAACTTSPVLCFQSNCTAQGALWITAQLPGGSSSTSSSSKHLHRFACPSGTTVDLAKVLPGRYLLGFLQCPSNDLVCESMGCSDCSSSGGYCSRGKCFCHMERFGPGCRSTLIPRL